MDWVFNSYTQACVLWKFVFRDFEQVEPSWVHVSGPVEGVLKTEITKTEDARLSLYIQCAKRHLKLNLFLFFCVYGRGCGDNS